MHTVEIARFSGNHMLNVLINNTVRFGYELVSCDGVVAVLVKNDRIQYLVSWDIAEHYTDDQIASLNTAIHSNM